MERISELNKKTVVSIECGGRNKRMHQLLLLDFILDSNKEEMKYCSTEIYHHQYNPIVYFCDIIYSWNSAEKVCICYANLAHMSCLKGIYRTGMLSSQVVPII